MFSQRTQKPVLYGRHWVAVTGKPIAATAGAMIFGKGGNAVDAACAMIAATSTMWDTLSWGGLKDILEPAIEMADGYVMDGETANTIERQKSWLKKWKYSSAVMLPHPGEKREGPVAGEIFRQPELAATLRKLVEAEQTALKSGKNRKDAIMAAYERFYKGDIAKEFVRGTQEEGGLITMDDLAKWKVHIEEPVSTSYKGIDVYKLNVWTQGPAMLQALNILENYDLKSMGYNSPKYIHTIYQAMNLAFADRDFYYGDTYAKQVAPVSTLLSKEYAKERAKLMNPDQNDATAKPGDPYKFKNTANPFADLLDKWKVVPSKTQTLAPQPGGDAIREMMLRDELADSFPQDRSFYGGTTSVEASDAEGWVVSVTPSGGWIPAVIAGHTGVGLSQRAQSFVTDAADGPYNVIEPGRHPRVTLTPTLALKDGKPYLCFSVQGGDSQDQNLLQFFLNTVEFGMNVQRATEAPNINSFQMRSSFGNHEIQPGKILLANSTTQAVRDELIKMGYTLTFEERTSGPINAIFLDQEHKTMWGGSSNHGDDYGIAW